MGRSQVMISTRFSSSSMKVPTASRNRCSFRFCARLPFLQDTASADMPDCTAGSHLLQGGIRYPSIPPPQGHVHALAWRVHF